ncbi:MAG: BatA domain-containing protein, partial [Verrucomicrobiota bacterium]|nr:BatA domain-containing protein [Verrucomicrobiota bacterium]
MNFLAPIFLVGAAAIVLPVLFHLVRQSARRRTLFSSLMFLRPALPRLTRRNKIDHLLLLVLRGLIVVLLAAAFARPFVRKAVVVPFAGAPLKRLVVLLDTSASMQREGLWEAACRHVEAAAQSAGANDDLALCTFDDGIVWRIGFEEWRKTAVQNRPGLVRERLAGLKPCWAATRLDRALIRATEMLELEGTDGERGSVREVVLVSDLAEGSVLDELAGYNWPKDVRLVARQITPRHSGNVGIHLSADAASTGGRGGDATKVRVIHAGTGGPRQVEIGWADAEGRFVSARVPVAV